ncbi:MAG TPA: lipid-A-disaccharide synthase [Coxiellaceae bacterium]|nr:lipid-A-disaccharide synthase [Coxiellaceae bacterium]
MYSLRDGGFPRGRIAILPLGSSCEFTSREAINQGSNSRASSTGITAQAPLKIGIVAGEDSGDILGASFIQSLRKQYPDAQIEGIAGPRMVAAGCLALYPTERLSVMGLIEPIKRLPEILSIRKNIYQHFIQNPPDVFIGIDAPDFNLTLEKKLKQHGIKTVHYVSPSVWAWRRGRIRTIKKAVDLMLVLFPFEKAFYQRYDLPVKFVGHPLADEIPLEVDRVAIRKKLGLDSQAKVLAILPGSREMELERLVPPFLQTAQACLQQVPALQIVTVMANEQREKQFRILLNRVAPRLSIRIYSGNSREIMAAADAVLLASGTASLEAMLCQCPMVVAYRIAPLSYFLARLLVHIKYFSLPNLIAGEKLVPEFLQKEVTAEHMAPILLDYLQNVEKTEALKQKFLALHQSLRCNASEQAVQVVLALLSIAD